MRGDGSPAGRPSLSMTIVHTDQPLKRVNDGEAVAPRRRIGNHPAGPIVLGTASWAVHDEPLDAGRATAVLAAALDGGVTGADTAFVYTTRTEMSYAERLVGAALKQIRTDESILVATKGGHHRDKDTFRISMGAPTRFGFVMPAQLDCTRVGADRAPLPASQTRS